MVAINYALIHGIHFVRLARGCVALPTSPIQDSLIFGTLWKDNQG